MPVPEGKFVPTSTEKNFEPLNYPDCVHLTEHGKCNILTVSKCMGRNCESCRSGAENRASEENCRRRLSSLDEEQQAKIAATYYGGKRPWRG